MIRVMMPATMAQRKNNEPAGRRIAMWSGPRNISTALMRAWENRADTDVVDEPFYACYLARTGHDHPGRERVLAAQPIDWREVVAALEQARPAAGRIVYEKQMAHHIDGAVGLGWLEHIDNVFLIREPRRMLASLLRVLPQAGIDETGLPQQCRLFAHLRERGMTPPVIDSADVLRDPRGTLTALCGRLGVEFSEAMLSWPAGPRASDGVWAPHWYAQVERSTGFGPYRDEHPEIPRAKLDLLGECERHYADLYAHRLHGTN